LNKKDWTVLEILNWTTNFFKEKNISEPKFDAEILLSHALNIKRLDLYLNFDRILKIIEIEFFKDLIKKRISRIPLAYILGEKEFMGCKIKVNENVLIPRYETEILVEETVKIFKDFFEKDIMNNNNNVNFVDICTGTGNIPISIANNLKKYKNNTFFYGVDISDKALTIAQQNIYNNFVTENVRLLQGNLFEPLESLPLKNSIDIITSNPPYIKTNELNSLEEEVKMEPKLALDGGEDGLIFYKKIINKAPIFLKKDGFIFFEIDPELKTDIVNFLETNNFYEIKIKKDYHKLDRIIIARRK
jgi:release factor glutamine methyltransferase